jgi:ubiquinone/menaquinone biosynthesis C-methylase UbiE
MTEPAGPAAVAGTATGTLAGTVAGEARPWGFASSTGLSFTHISIVDAHFAACREQYRQILVEAGIQPGWTVLDAGCGGGAFLHWLAELVTGRGRVLGVDLAPDNVAAARARVAQPDFAAPATLTVGDLAGLPFDDASVDAAWCANTVQYLDDDTLRRVLAELRRVLRPGGRLAVKELDAGLITIQPGAQFLVSDLFRAERESSGYARQLLRSRELYRWLRRAGFTDVRQRTVLIEHFGPLAPAAREFYGRTCAQLARRTRHSPDAAAWQPFLDPADPGNPLNDPECYVSEGNVLALGTRPGPDGAAGRLPSRIAGAS